MAGLRGRQAVHLCCKFPVCESQPFKEEAAGSWYGRCGEGARQQRGPICEPQTELCKHCFHVLPEEWKHSQPAPDHCAEGEAQTLDFPIPLTLPLALWGPFMESAAASVTWVHMCIVGARSSVLAAVASLGGPQTEPRDFSEP